MGIATRPGAQRSAFRLGSSARLAHVGPLQLEIRRLYSIKLKLLFNNVKHFSEVSFCGFYAPQAPGNSHCAPTATAESSRAVATSGRLPRRRCGDTFDEQPQREHDLEYECRKPRVESSQRPCGETGELQGLYHHEQARREQAQRCDCDGHHPSAQEEIGKDRTSHGKEDRTDGDARDRKSTRL